MFGRIVRIIIGYALSNVAGQLFLASRYGAALPDAHDWMRIAGGVLFAFLAWLTSGRARAVASTVFGSARFASGKEAKAGLGVIMA